MTLFGRQLEPLERSQRVGLDSDRRRGLRNRRTSHDDAGD